MIRLLKDKRLPETKDGNGRESDRPSRSRKQLGLAILPPGDDSHLGQVTTRRDRNHIEKRPVGVQGHPGGQAT